MSRRIIVEAGESMPSIALEHGYFWETIWNHGDNGALREERQDPFVLSPGDVVVLPPRSPKELPVETGKRHTFRRKGVPARFRMKVLSRGKPRRNAHYVLEIDGARSEGQTDEDGEIKLFVSPAAAAGKLTFDDGLTIPLRFGHLAPLTELRGVQMRLDALGFDVGAPDGALNEATQTAIAAFRCQRGLPAGAALDDDLRKELRAAYGC